MVVNLLCFLCTFGTPLVLLIEPRVILSEFESYVPPARMHFNVLSHSTDLPSRTDGTFLEEDRRRAWLRDRTVSPLTSPLVHT